MAGLLDDFTSFIKTPEGQGLLSGVFGYAANAKRGQPINSLGRGGIAGLMGYANAQDREAQQADAAFQQKYRTMQMGDMQRKLDQQAAQQKWLETLNPSQARLGAPVDQSQQMMWDAARNGVIPASDYIKTFLPDSEAYTLSPGQVRIKGGREVARGPEKQPGQDAKIEQYEYAVRNGYKGSFADFVSLGPTITANALAPLRAAQIESAQANDEYRLPPPRTPQPRAPASAPVTVTVNGQAFAFPNQQAAQQFKQKAGIR